MARSGLLLVAPIRIGAASLATAAAGAARGVFAFASQDTGMGAGSRCRITDTDPKYHFQMPRVRFISATKLSK